MKPALHFGLSIATAFAAASTFAAERVWDGNSRTSNDWTDAANWSSLGPPVDGDDLRFPAGALRPNNHNDFAVGTGFRRMTFAGAGYTVSGNEIGLADGLVVSHGAGITVVNLPINIEVNQTFMVSLAGATLFLNGPVDLGRTRSILTFDGAGQAIVVGNLVGSGLLGGASIRKNGTGTLYILQHPTFSGPTTVNGGTLRVDGSLSNSVVTLNAGATLLGAGKVGGLTANSGATVSPGASLPDILDSLGDVALNAGSTLNIRLNGTNAGVDYDQLRVQGTVTLGGTLNVTAGFTPAVGERFTLIDNDGTDDVVGTFAGLPEGAVLTINGRPFKISYWDRFGGFGRDANNVTLEAVPALSVWDGGGGLNMFWSLPLNWVGDVLPMPGDDLQFVNAGAGTLITSNDFPAGRPVGSMIFVGGKHLAGGNLAQIHGGIQVNVGSAPGQANQLVEIALPLVLGASQSFAVNHSNAVLFTEGPIDLGGHNLVAESQVRYSFGSSEYSQISIFGGLTGQGTLIKNGPGNLSLLSPSTCAQTVINGGAFRSSAFYPSPMSGNVTVNAGSILEAEDNVGGTIIVNSGGVLRGIFASLGGDVVIDGGTFQAWPAFPTVTNNLRMNSGSRYEVVITRCETNYVAENGARVGGAVELADCTLSVTIGTPLVPGAPFSILTHSNNGRAGVFAGLPDGSRFLAGGRLLTIRYTPYAVLLIADEPFIWDGGGSGNLWTTPTNWLGDLAPVADLGLDLIFPANVGKFGMINDLAPGAGFASLTFTGPDYLLVGNPFRLIQGLTNDFLSGDTVISADFVAAGSPFECRVSNNSRLRLEGGVSGDTPTATWRKTGSGTLRFAGTAPNNHSRVEVWGGELELDKTPGVDAISTRLEIGDGTNTVRVTLLSENQIADDAVVAIHNAGRLDLNGQSETIGQLQGEGTVSLEGRFVPGRSGRLTVGGGSFHGVIVGRGGLTKTGFASSALTLTGENPFVGLTIVNSGQLRVDGVQSNSPIRLDGGVLTGRGLIGPITGNLGGILQPGIAGPAFQNRLQSRDVALNSSTTFRPVLTSFDPGFENSYLQVSGAVSLGGCVLSVDLLGVFRPTNGASFLIIDNDGSDPVIGTFASLPEAAVFGGDGLPFRISYVGGTGNDVIITRIAAPVSTLRSITALGNGQVKLEGLGIGGVNYPIQAASNLNPVIQWTPVGNATADAGGLFQHIDAGASNRPMRFYRAVSP